MSRWFNERRRETYHRKAKKEGYRARSAYKLLQIQQRFAVFHQGDAVIDLGCAPGGWSQVLVEMVGEGGFIAGVDLQRVKPLEGAHFIQGDFTKVTTQRRLEEVMAKHDVARVDVVVSDMAPDMSGNYDLDQARSVALCEIALRFACNNLHSRGNYICKVFEGADFQDFREMMRHHFKSVRQFRPPASRKQSSEVYLVGKGYRGLPYEEQ